MVQSALAFCPRLELPVVPEDRSGFIRGVVDRKLKDGQEF